MKTIHKYALVPPFILQIPMDAKILHLDSQDNFPYIWVELDTDAVYINRHFMVIGTGHPFPEHVTKKEYVGSLKLDNEKVMIHVYEELETTTH